MVAVFPVLLFAVMSQPPSPLRWTKPTVTPVSALPILRGGVAHVRPGAACPAWTGKPVRVGSVIVNIPLLEYVEPDPPAKDLAGTVIIEVAIATDGSVSRASLLRGDSGLAAPVMSAASRWRYARTCIGGSAVPLITTFALSRVAAFRFRIERGR